MRDCLVPVIGAVSVLLLVSVWPSAARAGDAAAVAPFESPSFNRTVQGRIRSVELTARGCRLGRADVFFGVDSLSNASSQYLTSGLQWQAEAPGRSQLRLSALQTESRGAVIDSGQILLRAENTVDLGDRWYLPDVRLEFARVRGRDAKDPAFGGAALRLGLRKALGPAHYRFDYFRSDPSFRALGSALVAGEDGFEFASDYRLGDSWRLSHEVELHGISPAHDGLDLIQQWTVAATPARTDVARPWRLSARVGAVDPAQSGQGTPLALELASRTANWRSWRLGSSVGWYGHGMRAPLALPVDGPLWQVSASRGLSIAGLETRFAPTFAVGGVRGATGGFGSRTGLEFGFTQLSDAVGFRLDYLSSGWSAQTGDDAMRLSLNYTRSTGALMAGLESLTRRLRLPWQRRY